jgi:LPS export ABC transporter protein LptC
MMTEHRTRPEGFAGWWGVREVDALFGRFARYTKFVVYSKRGLLGVAGVLVMLLIGWPLVTQDKSGIRISFVDSKTAPQSPSSPVMNNPEYRGTSVNGREYKVTGKTATQKSSTLVIIDTVEAVLMKPDGGWQMLTADMAEYHQASKRIELMGNVQVSDNAGTNFITKQATINTETMHIIGNKPVQGQGAHGNIVASGFEIKDNGERILFFGGAEPLKVQLERAVKKKK